jgi:integrase
LKPRKETFPAPVVVCTMLARGDHTLGVLLHRVVHWSQYGRATIPGTKGWRFWLPLVCLFMGMRPNEAAQMLTHDLRCTDQGTWYLDIVATGDDDADGHAFAPKTLKTATSRRKIPLHPKLIAIGFLKFVENRKKVDPASLFPDLTPNQYGNRAWYALKRFNETYLPKAIKLEARQSFYSFRHSFRDALRRIHAPPDALQALGGWKQGRLTSDNYGDATNPNYHVQFAKQIAFPGLDLSTLYPKAK